MRVFSMLITVKLDDQASAMLRKVHNVVAKDDLTAKVKALGFQFAQLMPEFAFEYCRFSAEPGRMSCQDSGRAAMHQPSMPRRCRAHLSANAEDDLLRQSPTRNLRSANFDRPTRGR